MKDHVVDAAAMAHRIRHERYETDDRPALDPIEIREAVACKMMPTTS